MARVSDRLVWLLERAGVDEHALVLIIAGVVGVLSGLAILVFYNLIDLTTALVARLSE